MHSPTEVFCAGCDKPLSGNSDTACLYGPDGEEYQACICDDCGYLLDTRHYYADTVTDNINRAIGTQSDHQRHGIRRITKLSLVVENG